MNCSHCLLEHVKIVPLVNGVCPECKTDYREFIPAKKTTEYTTTFHLPKRRTRDVWGVDDAD